jgi:hypothetical protein
MIQAGRIFAKRSLPSDFPAFRQIRPSRIPFQCASRPRVITAAHEVLQIAENGSLPSYSTAVACVCAIATNPLMFDEIPGDWVEFCQELTAPGINRNVVRLRVSNRVDIPQDPRFPHWQNFLSSIPFIAFLYTYLPKYYRMIHPGWDTSWIHFTGISPMAMQVTLDGYLWALERNHRFFRKEKKRQGLLHNFILNRLISATAIDIGYSVQLSPILVIQMDREMIGKPQARKRCDRVIGSDIYDPWAVARREIFI